MKEFIERLRKNTALGNLIHSRGAPAEDQMELFAGGKYRHYEARAALKKEIADTLKVIDDKIETIITEEFMSYIFNKLIGEKEGVEP